MSQTPAISGSPPGALLGAAAACRRLVAQGARSFRRRAPILGVGLFLIAGALGLRIVEPPLVSQARLEVFDSYQRMEPRAFAPAPVRVIDIDDESLRRLGQWPWPRDLVAELIDRLTASGARVIALDVLFAEPDRTAPALLRQKLSAAEDDGPLGRALASLPDHDHLLAQAFGRGRVVTGFALSSGANAVRPTAKTAFATVGQTNFDIGDDFPGAIANLPVLETAAAGNGSLSIVADEDEVVRRVPVVQRIGETLLPSLPVEALRVAQGVTTLKARFHEQGGTLRVGRVDIPFDRDGKYGLHHRPILPGDSLPVWHLFDETRRDAVSRQLKDHIVFIGTSAAGLKDLRTTPLAAFTPGVFVHAQALEQMLTGQPLERPLWVTGLEVSVMLAAAVVLLAAFTWLPARCSAVLALLVIGVSLSVSWLAFRHFQILVDPVWPSITVVALYVTIMSLTYMRTERERSHIRRAFGQYMAPALVNTLVEDPGRLKLGGEVRDMTFLFSDIAGFTPFVERTSPEQLVELLNAYLDRVCAIVMEHGGTLDKIVGDAVHAIFNAPLDQPDHAERAVRCALAIDAFSSTFVVECAARGVEFGHTRLGINTGPAVIGNFGGESRFDYTAHGDSINLAARLEGVNKWIGSRICVAGSSAEQCPSIAFRSLGELLVVGRSKPVATFEPLSEADAASERIVAYRRAFALMAEEQPEALSTFARLCQQFPDDAVIAFHHHRLAEGERGSIIKMSSK
ncbi:MAG: CHASE2 domain-containing protein [Geminicoccaceae bacterium]